MKICQISTILAYAAAVYIMGSIIYLLVTRSYGTPFKNAIQKYPELKKIKMESVRKRKLAFYGGVCSSIIVLAILRPFGKCW